MAATLHQYGVSGHDASATVNLSGTYTAGTWQDIGIDRGDLTSGIYIAHVFADTHLLGVTQYSSESISEPFAWTSTGSNSNVRGSITFSSSFMGHAPNSYQNPNNMFEFGYLHFHGGVAQELQIKFNNTMTFANTSGRMFNINLYRYK